MTRARGLPSVEVLLGLALLLVLATFAAPVEFQSVSAENYERLVGEGPALGNLPLSEAWGLE